MRNYVFLKKTFSSVQSGFEHDPFSVVFQALSARELFKSKTVLQGGNLEMFGLLVFCRYMVQGVGLCDILDPLLIWNASHQILRNFFSCLLVANVKHTSLVCCHLRTTKHLSRERQFASFCLLATWLLLSFPRWPYQFNLS